MNIQNTLSNFSSKEIVEIVSTIINLKIKHLESKISRISSEEEIKLWETKIKRLQNELMELKKSLKTTTGDILLKYSIDVV